MIGLTNFESLKDTNWIIDCENDLYKWKRKIKDELGVLVDFPLCIFYDYSEQTTKLLVDEHTLDVVNEESYERKKEGQVLRPCTIEDFKHVTCVLKKYLLRFLIGTADEFLTDENRLAFVRIGELRIIYRF